MLGWVMALLLELKERSLMVRSRYARIAERIRIAGFLSEGEGGIAYFVSLSTSED